MLRMSRPGEKITRKSILMQKKIKEIDKTEDSSKSLLANVLDRQQWESQKEHKASSFKWMLYMAILTLKGTLLIKQS